MSKAVVVPRRRTLGKALALASGAAVATGLSAPAAQAAYRPACVTLHDVAPKGLGVVGRVKFACPPTGMSQWRYTLTVTSMPDCDFAALPGMGQGGPFARTDTWPINRLIETSVAGKVNRVNDWQACLTVYEMNSDMVWKQIHHSCRGMVLDTYK
ncbi:MAG: hypothetical protein V9E83_12670 [Baekduia sp.]